MAKTKAKALPKKKSVRVAKTKKVAAKKKK